MFFGIQDRQTDGNINPGGGWVTTLAVLGLKELFFAVLERFLQPTLCRCSAQIWLVIHKNNM
jgi:hypothetical protein